MTAIDLNRSPTTLPEARSMLEELKGELLTVQGELSNKGINPDGTYRQSYSDFTVRRAALVKRHNLLVRKIIEVKAVVKRLNDDEWVSEQPPERAMQLLRKLFHEVELTPEERRVVANFSEWVKEQRNISQWPNARPKG